jgi:NAD(P)-dependent dehydrogenase (short-subunit alcohol dehydrogenase family)
VTVHAICPGPVQTDMLEGMTGQSLCLDGGTLFL